MTNTSLLRRPRAHFLLPLTFATALLVACSPGPAASESGEPNSSSSPGTDGPSASASPSASSGEVTPSPGATVATGGATPAGTGGSTTTAAAKGFAVVVTVAPFHAGDDALEVTGVVTGIAEDAGDCRFVLSPPPGDLPLPHLRRERGVKDGNATSCGTVSLSADGLTAGTWTVTLEYQSSGNRDAVAKSAEVTVTIP